MPYLLPLLVVWMQSLFGATPQLIDETGTLHPSMAELATFLEVPWNDDIAELVWQTQGSWLRGKRERWELSEIQMSEENKEHAFALIEEIGCFDRVTPEESAVDYVLVLGATLPSVKNRLHYLGELWKNGLRFKHLVLLGSERPLDPNVEEELFGKVKSESEMMRHLFEILPLPKEMLQVKKTLISTPMGERRPNTRDTLLSWLAKKPKPGRCIAISSQPFVGYQHAVLKGNLPKTFQLETVGKEVTTVPKLRILLDTLARWLYSESHERTMTAH